MARCYINVTLELQNSLLVTVRNQPHREDLGTRLRNLEPSSDDENNTLAGIWRNLHLQRQEVWTPYSFYKVDRFCKMDRFLCIIFVYENNKKNDNEISF